MLFDPIAVGNLTLKNRIIMPALDLGYCPDGAVTDRLIDFYTERARGGAGLIMVGGAAIEPTGIYRGFLSIHDDELIPGHRLLTSSIKAEGSHIGIQLFHAGRYSFAFTKGKKVVAPSAVPSKLTGHTPQELTVDEIQELISCFADAAGRAQKAGYDMVEVISSAGYLLNQFLSPLTNQRNDGYGGTPEKRMRFGLEVIKAIREKVGPDFTLSVRLGASDYIPGGNTWREMAVFAKELEKLSVNLLNVNGGWHESKVPQIQAEVPRGAYAFLAAKIKSAVNIPVAASNRINDPRIAEKILGDGQADLVSVGRGFMADPQWAVKAQAGKPQTIRKCIGCMTCLDKVFGDESQGNDVICAVNPQCGREDERSIIPASRPRKVLIIGAGPAGLEAARVAALKGHNVLIWEKEDKIGGQWNIASVPPGKGEFSSLIEYYKNILTELKVQIHLNTKADIDSVKAADPDAVLVATGAQPLSPSIPAAGDAKIANAWDVLKGEQVYGPDIVVIGGGAVGCETALYLAEKGTIDANTLKFMMLHQMEDPDTLYDLLTRGSFRVTVVEMKKGVAMDMPKTMRWTVLKHMQTMGIKIFDQTTVKEITPAGVKAENNGKETFINADTVVTAVGSRPERSLYEDLKQELSEVHLLGDAVQPSTLKNAVHSAFELANRL
ncbi:MAG: FAD-dependent oxidoreductase [Syntrophomonadaceae bacterium]|nr:FAD-dependent oxidoreductase [Syntrophomonadaceae bacterium]